MVADDIRQEDKTRVETERDRERERERERDDHTHTHLAAKGRERKHVLWLVKGTYTHRGAYLAPTRAHYRQRRLLLLRLRRRNRRRWHCGCHVVAKFERGQSDNGSARFQATNARDTSHNITHTQTKTHTHTHTPKRVVSDGSQCAVQRAALPLQP